jgi:hypothetical protein
MLFLARNMDNEYFLWPVKSPVREAHLAHRAMQEWVCFPLLQQPAPRRSRGSFERVQLTPALRAHGYLCRTILMCAHLPAAAPATHLGLILQKKSGRPLRPGRDGHFGLVRE